MDRLAARQGGQAPGADSALLSVRRLGLRFGGIVALDGVSFDVEAGQIAGLIGPNGAGKTTLFNCISRLYEGDKGAILFAGRSLLGVPRHRIAGLGIARTFQNLALFGSLSVQDNVKVGRHCRGTSGFAAHALRLPFVAAEAAVTQQRTEELLAFVGLESVAAVAVDELPLATRKRVELARALAGEPRLLLLDEPACGLNHAEVDALARLIRDIRDRLHVTVLLVEHHMGLVMSLCDKPLAQERRRASSACRRMLALHRSYTSA